jgi:hypothetical protein
MRRTAQLESQTSASALALALALQLAFAFGLKLYVRATTECSMVEHPPRSRSPAGWSQPEASQLCLSCPSPPDCEACRAPSPVEHRAGNGRRRLLQHPQTWSGYAKSRTKSSG